MPVHGLIHARDDSIVSSRHGMAAKTKGRTQKITRPYQKASEATKAPCGNQGSPQPGSPRSHGAANRHNNSPIATSKQTTTTPRRNESGEKKGETESETRANVRRANVKRTVKQPCGCAQSPLSSDHHTLGQFPVLSTSGACWMGTAPKDG